MGAATLSLDNEVFAKFVFYAGVVLLKTVMMSVWIVRYRLPRKVTFIIILNMLYYVYAYTLLYCKCLKFKHQE